jgi:O-antigen/teichoic acid export membrane protein
MRASIQRIYLLFINTVNNYVNLYILNQQRAGDFVYLSSQISAPVVGFITSFIAARYLLPYELGVIQTVMLITVYCSFFHFGVFNGLNRNIAFYDAQQNKSKIQDMVDASWLTAIINSFIGIMISLIILIYFVLNGYSSLYFYSVVILLGILTFSPICTHYETIYRGCRAFMPLGILLNISNGINLIFGFLPIFIGAFGLIIRSAVLPTLNFLLLYRKSPIKPYARGSIDEVLALARIGFPMLVTGVLYVFFTAADRTIVALTLGPTAVGQLALSGMIVTAIQILPVSLGALLYPRASYIYGLSKTSLGLRRFFFSV